ncbi:Polyketide cyclase / dehydrase and lipid transport [Haloechinothrix alba]|uniref:Polyketide cyclase / dehydrase and lipid transport n=1 Tax=Haloechinothrix alba TaxID=664784 RepID=A0A238UYV8_9PSEU|nr:SRPBCC family protein [Haloechinothrix alba]SNR27101.1 Polyketide cyclase / dehydrase and lipid transport [Haloechinothrix alba]
MTDIRPDATAEIQIDAPAERVYEIISDPGVLAECAAEYEGYRWLGGMTRSEVGARFVGRNRKGWQRWMTVARITDADRGKRFAFDVTAGPVKAARWQYDIEPGDQGCKLVESAWDRRPRWLGRVLDVINGVDDRAANNQANIEATLRGIKMRAENG